MKKLIVLFTLTTISHLSFASSKEKHRPSALSRPSTPPVAPHAKDFFADDCKDPACTCQSCYTWSCIACMLCCTYCCRTKDTSQISLQDTFVSPTSSTHEKMN